MYLGSARLPCANRRPLHQAFILRPPRSRHHRGPQCAHVIEHAGYRRIATRRGYDWTHKFPLIAVPLLLAPHLGRLQLQNVVAMSP
jgi:hypothetical protein